MPYKDPLEEIEKGKRFRRNHPNYSTEYYARNREKLVQKQSEWRAANPEKLAESNFKAGLKSRYNLSVEKFNEILQAQKHRCAICRKSFNCQKAVKTPQEARGIKVDHCHNGGHVRGLLCQQCNLAIGAFKNSSTLCLHGANYLSREIIFNGQ